MKTSIRIVKFEGKTFLQLIDLKYKNRVVAEKELSNNDCIWLIKELAKEVKI